jgi:hypothetical protein
MNSTIAFAAAGLISLGIVGSTPAAAFHLSPTGNFTGEGKTSATKNGVTLPCIAHFTGKVTTAGVGYVTSGTFTDNGGIGCTSVKLSHLPWRAVAVNARRARIANVTFTSPIGNCGPGYLPVALKNGVIRFTTVALPGGCTVSGTITTSPKVSIVP